MMVFCSLCHIHGTPNSNTKISENDGCLLGQTSAGMTFYLKLKSGESEPQLQVFTKTVNMCAFLHFCKSLVI